MLTSLVIIPTYNERENIAPLLDSVLRHLPDADVLVVDDSSPDGTAEVARACGQDDGRVKVLERPGKAGLGVAYTAGFQWALARDYDTIIGMDADFSLAPE